MDNLYAGLLQICLNEDNVATANAPQKYFYAF